MKQILLAMHNYHDTFGDLPPHSGAKFADDGKPLLSWRVHILPFIEEQRLYDQFKLDEPWDSEHNKKLIDKMPKIYSNPQVKLKDGTLTTYVVPVGDKTLFPKHKGKNFADVTDGLSNTIAVLEVDPDQAVVWTKPDDWEFNPDKPFAGLGGNEKKTFLVGMADGSVRYFSLDLDPKNMRRLIERNDGEPIDP